MNERIERYLDTVFHDLPSTQPLKELREEIKGNLLAQIADLQTEGYLNDEAFELAISQLGDIVAIAQSLCEEKPPQEKSQKLIAFCFAGAIMIILFGLVAASVSALVNTDKAALVFFGTNIPFLTSGCGLLGFCLYLYHQNSFERKIILRGSVYGASCAVLVFGLLVMAVSYCREGDLALGLAPAIPFIIPAVGVLCYLLATEPHHRMTH